MGPVRVITHHVAGLILAVCVGILLPAPSAGAKNDFEIAQPEATPDATPDATHLQCIASSTSKMYYNPEPTYKPIKGVRITVQNAEKQKEAEEKIKKKKKEIRTLEDGIREGKKRVKAYHRRYVAPACMFMAGSYMESGVTGFRSVTGNTPEMYYKRYSTISVFRPGLFAGGIVDIAPYLLEGADAGKAFVTEKKKKLKSLKDELATLKEESRLDSDGIVFNSCDITDISHITVSQMKELLSGTEFKQFADVYVEIEKEYGINAIAFCALSALESGWGTSRRARYDHNYTGFGVYSDDAPGIHAGSGEENLEMTARHLAEKYIHKGDVYYHGRGLDGINRSYAASRTWAYGVEDIGIRLMRKLQQGHFYRLSP